MCDDGIADDDCPWVPSEVLHALIFHLSLYDDGIGTTYNVTLVQNTLWQLFLPTLLLLYPRLQTTMRCYHQSATLTHGQIDNAAR